MVDILQVVGERVRVLRAEAGLSQADLADAIGMSRAFVGAVERGEKAASLTTLDRLAAGIGVPLSSFFEVEERRRQPTQLQREARLGHLLTVLAKDASDEVLERFEKLMRAYFAPLAERGPKKRRPRGRSKKSR